MSKRNFLTPLGVSVALAMAIGSVIMIIALMLTGERDGKEVRKEVKKEKGLTTELVKEGVKVMGFPLPRKNEELYAKAVVEIYLRESKCGTDPKARRGVIGLKGEQGDFQVTPIWCEDIKRLFGEEVHPYNNVKLWGQIIRWLEYYGPRVGAVTVDDLAEMYRRGPSGFREWKKEKR